MTIEAESNSAVAAAYDDDANLADFYRLCWGGTDIHIGRNDSGHESVAKASAAMTRRLLDLAVFGRASRLLSEPGRGLFLSFTGE